ncbi:hypothetical protein NX059_008066 [Plenodomus lindquistii]|nr:hypothetical protein NX059_008066 [Plenodomus lindquistii]
MGSRDELVMEIETNVVGCEADLLDDDVVAEASSVLELSIFSEVTGVFEVSASVLEDLVPF